MPLIAWDKFCRPKSHRRLGLLHTVPTDAAFQCKLIWKMFNKLTNLLAQFLKQKYCQSSGLLEKAAKSIDSWVYKTFRKSFPIFHKGIRWKISEGKDIKFWTNNWCHERNLTQLTNIDPSTVNLETQVNEFILLNRWWDIPKLNQFLRPSKLSLELLLYLRVSLKDAWLTLEKLVSTNTLILRK